MLFVVRSSLASSCCAWVRRVLVTVGCSLPWNLNPLRCCDQTRLPTQPLACLPGPLFKCFEKRPCDPGGPHWCQAAMKVDAKALKSILKAPSLCHPPALPPPAPHCPLQRGLLPVDRATHPALHRPHPADLAAPGGRALPAPAACHLAAGEPASAGGWPWGGEASVRQGWWERGKGRAHHARANTCLEDRRRKGAVRLRPSLLPPCSHRGPLAGD